MIAGYTSMDDHWTAVSTFEEKQFGYVVAQIYAAAFQEERTKLINSE